MSRASSVSERLAFLCARESTKAPRLGPMLKKEFGGVYVANEGFDQQSAENAIEAGEADAVAFGKLFIANPDLARALQAEGAPQSLELRHVLREGPVGYTDYPELTREAAE